MSDANTQDETIVAAQEQLLGLCARPTSSPAQLAALSTAVHDERLWNGLVERAEREGLGPLLRHHLTQAGITIPREVERALGGLWLRHSKLAKARRAALSELLQACAGQNIELLLLKGAGLAHVAYPEPGLRPMRDVDVLVRGEDLERTEALLRELGYRAREEYSDDHHHLAPMYRERAGLTLGVELHKQLERAYALELESLREGALHFQLDGVPAQCPGPLPMLRHVYVHGFRLPMRRAESFRLIWAADVIAVVEKFVDQLDWPALKQSDPILFRALRWFGCLTPWSERVEAQVGAPPVVKQADEPLSRVAARATRSRLPGAFPPSVWLGIRYGLASERALPWARTKHALEVLTR